MANSMLTRYLESFAGLPRSAWLLAAVLLVNTSGAMVVFFLTLYLTQHMGASAGLAGAGLLDSTPHTSNYPDFLKLCPQYQGEAYYSYEPAVDAGGLITASGIAPLEFSRLVIKALDVFKPETLDAWDQLYRTKSENSYYELMASLD
jgi:hypothetical protein